MLSNIQKTIIIRATRIRMAAGEEPDAIVASYTKLTEEEKLRFWRRCGTSDKDYYRETTVA